ncbi:hypothetical protein B0H19DRAFT_1349847 [Mycena capillaripes]|nr:hypothetical protein B0H19DRAFT_1349847 [Mycena capillaripes]
MAHCSRALLSFILFLWPRLVIGLNSALQQVTDFGVNPTNVGMFVYIPTSVAANPAVVVAIHDCNGTAQTYFSTTPYAQFADTYGFIVIYPSSPHADTCWDLTSPATLTHNGGGDSQGIASMVEYVVSNYSADSTRVFATGTASGEQHRNDDEYPERDLPELWSAVTIYSGAAAGCFVNVSCTVDDPQMGAIYWAEVARAMYPGYTGTYPPVQVWLSTTTADFEYGEHVVSQWIGIFGYDVGDYVPQQYPDYQRQIFGPGLQGISYCPVTHPVSTLTPSLLVAIYFFNGVAPIPVQGNMEITWFGIASLPPPAFPPPPPPGTCGGQGWTGATVCLAPYTCTVNNAFFSQCL